MVNRSRLFLVLFATIASLATADVVDHASPVVATNVPKHATKLLPVEELSDALVSKALGIALRVFPANKFSETNWKDNLKRESFAETATGQSNAKLVDLFEKVLHNLKPRIKAFVIVTIFFPIYCFKGDDVVADVHKWISDFFNDHKREILDLFRVQNLFVRSYERILAFFVEGKFLEWARYITDKLRDRKVITSSKEDIDRALEVLGKKDSVVADTLDLFKSFITSTEACYPSFKKYYIWDIHYVPNWLRSFMMSVVDLFENKMLGKFLEILPQSNEEVGLFFRKLSQWKDVKFWSELENVRTRKVVVSTGSKGPDWTLQKYLKKLVEAVFKFVFKQVERGSQRVRGMTAALRKAMFEMVQAIVFGYMADPIDFNQRIPPPPTAKNSVEQQIVMADPIDFNQRIPPLPTAKDSVEQQISNPEPAQKTTTSSSSSSKKAPLPPFHAAARAHWISCMSSLGVAVLRDSVILPVHNELSQRFAAQLSALGLVDKVESPSKEAPANETTIIQEADVQPDVLPERHESSNRWWTIGIVVVSLAVLSLIAVVAIINGKSALCGSAMTVPNAVSAMTVPNASAITVKAD